MSFNIEQGLFGFDLTDYHAILGVPVDAEAKDIRKRYLTIARRLHPDSCAAESEVDRQRASEYLSKLVNPAYEQLSQERNFTEHQVLLKMKGQQALRQQDTIVLMSDTARRLAGTGDIDQTYRGAIRELAEQQYQSLEQTLDRIGQISELNLVYLMRKHGQADGTAAPRPTANRPSASGKPAARPGQPAPPPPPPPTRESIVASNLRRAQEYEAKNDFASAIRELREALQLSPTNAQCHSRLGVVYMKLKQETMAKIHFNQALKLNPQDAIALEGKRRLDMTSGQAAAPPQKTPPKAPPKASPKDDKGGGLFGLFGKKK
ncbi:tetratricopeptide repeat protein [Microcoleus sp. FACHB-1515]|uniref:tetratricopeptide repeat protein n=1 Tax=Cyanophyceae TaxID=3028117 RepID=UPI001686F3C5|nr:tetratricopeptide repeat protein [Microcoleus sp. FACHB-1515]MBD2090987.1 tetratricopeptide repeat protein [Microcoleus sp. FACHB-1515]